MEWIKIDKDDRKTWPPIKQVVLTIDKKGYVRDAIRLDDSTLVGPQLGEPSFWCNYEARSDKSANCGHYNVTHWMPLPEKPRCA